jgi:cytochrome c biogenesis protein CcmG/thiol:disulfide interchange protein DsbE
VVEHPVLVSLKARGLPIVGVAWRDKPQNTKNFLLQRGDPYAPVLMDPDGKAAIELGITAAPESFLVDANGMIVQKISGAISPAAADALLRKAGLGT